MATARGFHTATLLADGRVLIAGGSSGGLELDHADPRLGRDLRPDDRHLQPDRLDDSAVALYHTATLLADGRVLITGGSRQRRLGASPRPSSTTRRPARSAATGSMADARVYQTATLLADGRVLVAGGGGDYANRLFLASAEIYDPDDRHLQRDRLDGRHAHLPRGHPARRRPRPRDRRVRRRRPRSPRPSSTTPRPARSARPARATDHSPKRTRAPGPRGIRRSALDQASWRTDEEGLAHWT